MKVLLFKVGKKPEVIDIEPNLETYQKLVDGYIECYRIFHKPLTVVCNDEGKINGMLPNRKFHDTDGVVLDVICGDFFICGETGGDFTDISDEDIKWCKEYFK